MRFLKLAKLGVVSAILCSATGDANAEECHTFFPDEANQDSLLVLARVNHAGYSDDGTLKWPNGKVFYRRHSGYSDDAGLFWRTGKALLRSHKGYSDDESMFWPNGKPLLRKHTGYSDDGSTFHANGSSWLLRHAGYSDDKSRSGSARSKYNDRHHSITARLDGDRGVKLNAKTIGDDWTVTIDYGARSGIRITECLVELDDYSAPNADRLPNPQVHDFRPSRPRPAAPRSGSYTISSRSYSSRSVDNGVERRYDSREQHGGSLPMRPTPPARHARPLAPQHPPHSTKIAENYDACVEWAYKQFFKTYNSSDARSAARAGCKNTDLSVARLVQPYYFKTYNGADAVRAALKNGKHAVLGYRLGIIRYAMKNYFKTYNGADAARKAVEKAKGLHSRLDAHRVLSCLKTEFPIQFKTYNGADAMNVAFKSCSE